jgi:hypothetical protein
MPVYASDAFAYDFDAALDAAFDRERRQWARVDEVETALGARLTCEAEGMPRVTERQLARHEQLYGTGHVEELLPYLGLSGTSESRLATDGGQRPLLRATRSDDRVPWGSVRARNLGKKILALHARGRSAMTIADTLGKSDRVVRRYLSEAERAGLLSVARRVRKFGRGICREILASENRSATDAAVSGGR